jgi:hypothetical protein
VIQVPLAFFADPSSVQTMTIEHRGVPRQVIRYAYRGHDIWGATAAMIRAFLDALSAFRAQRGVVAR